MSGDGGGEAVVSLETATLNGDGRGGGDKVLSLAVVTLILSVDSLLAGLSLLLQSGSSSSSLALFQFQGNILFLLSNSYSSKLLNSSSSSLPR